MAPENTVVLPNCKEDGTDMQVIEQSKYWSCVGMVNYQTKHTRFDSRIV